MTALDTAIRLAKSGLSVIPIRADATKAPACEAWKEFQTRIPSEVEIRRMFRKDCGVGIVAGEVSGNLEVLDVENEAPFAEFCELVREHDPTLIDLLPRVETPSGGHHLFYRCEEIAGNQKLAMKAGMKGNPDEVLFETRGQGGYVLTINSPAECHEERKPYRLVHGRLTQIPRITPAERSLLFDCARSFNQIRKEKREPKSVIAKNGNGNGPRPGDVFAERVSWREVLQPHGWVCVGTRGEESYWRRPGKAFGLSASLNYGGYDLFYVFSTNAHPFEHETSYSKFAAYALLNHSADYKAAARSLAERFGMKSERRLGDTERPEEPSDTPRPVLVRLSDVKPEDVQWLWPARIAKGKLSLVIGDPGNGKSTALIDVACRITRGAEWPDGCRAESGSVIILTAEDGLADTVRPRVDVQGGDASSIHVLQAIRSGEEERPFSLAADLPHLEAAIKAVRNARIIIIDPLSAYLGDKNSHKDSEIRTLLTPLTALAERYGVALAGILHLTKDDQRKALYRAQGTIAFVAAARTVFAVGRDSDNPDRRIFVCVKNNLAAHPPALAFSIVEQAGRGRLEWEREPVNDVDADSVLSMSLTLAERENRQNVDSFLRELLGSGPVASAEVYQAVRQNGFSDSTVNRAKVRLGIDAMKTGQPGERGQKWYWVLPKIVTKVVNNRNVTTFEQTEQPKADDSIPSPKIVTKVGMTIFDDNLREEREIFEP